MTCVLTLMESAIIIMSQYSQFLIFQNQSSLETTDPSKLILGPVVQSIVSLTSSLRGQLVKCFTTL